MVIISLPATVLAITDLAKGVQYTSVDAEAIRVIALGVQKVRTITVTVTVPARSATSGRATVYSSTTSYLVIKSVKSSLSGTLRLVVDGVESAIPVSQDVLLDLEAIYGYRLYGSSIEVSIDLPSEVTENTQVSITVNGAETVSKVQTPAST
ncbi:MAG: hypothetical protein QXW41_08095 [Fervidicoccaceae archaeon]